MMVVGVGMCVSMMRTRDALCGMAALSPGPGARPAVMCPSCSAVRGMGLVTGFARLVIRETGGLEWL